MPTEPESTPEPRPKRRPPRGKPVNDGFVVFYVDGFAQMTPEQKSWPVVTFDQMTGKAPPPIRITAPPPPATEQPPPPPGEQPPPA